MGFVQFLFANDRYVGNRLA